jgi:hypothetical protein
VNNRTVFQDDVYNNRVENNTISISSNSNDLYEDEYYMSNRNSFYNPYFLHRSRYGFCVVNNSFYNPYFWYSPYNHYPYWTNRGWNYVYYNYGSWYNPYYNHNNYMWQGNNLTTYNQSYNQNYNTINTPRRSTISSHRGNPNTIGTTTPTYSRSSYTKSNNNSNHNKQPLIPNVNNDLDNKVDSYRRTNTNVNNNRTNVRTYTPSTTPRTYTPSTHPVRTTPTYKPTTTPPPTRTTTRRP